MATRTKTVPVAQSADGSVQPRRRAAAIKGALKNYAQDETVEISAKWNEATKTWAITFVDE